MRENTTKQILLVEDNSGDVMLINKALEEIGITDCCMTAKDGEQAVEMLLDRADGEFKINPDLIILDLNLPKKSGIEVLKEIKMIDGRKQIPVVIFSSSESPEDVRNAYMYFANCYVVKPFDFNEYSSVVQKIWLFWMSTARL